ncbi:hypothetical protein KP509_27G027400 [Ceratopteris richardii]|uniref:GATA transcription factor n=1 Tax=Ceratopteris richardii TaxID=49495 RepID=A0A8T2RES1_CERRI|nr:hypothetical protein KP509_27G027400 [Ceratopteris richardii]
MDMTPLASDGGHVDFLGIDDLLDFTNDDIAGPIECPALTFAVSGSSNLSKEASAHPSQGSSPAGDGFVVLSSGCFNSGELCVPCDELAELEWLSNFVEESFSSADHHASTGYSFVTEGTPNSDEFKSHKPSPDFHSSLQQSTSPRAEGGSSEKSMSVSHKTDISIPARARTKRGRTAVCFWNTKILSAEASESILDSSSTGSTITSDSDAINAFYDNDDDDDYDENEEEVDDEDDEADDFGDDHIHYTFHLSKRPPSVLSFMKAKKSSTANASFSNKLKKTKLQGSDQQQQHALRKCLHCAATKTPQWRAGPMGPKTLCNACGVRYKSGRLCEEYRPAASPTFIEHVHSNSHRKVIEMRRQKGDLTPLSCSTFAGRPPCGDGGL